MQNQLDNGSKAAPMLPRRQPKRTHATAQHKDERTQHAPRRRQPALKCENPPHPSESTDITCHLAAPSPGKTPLNRRSLHRDNGLNNATHPETDQPTTKNTKLADEIKRTIARRKLGAAQPACLRNYDSSKPKTARQESG